MFNWQGVDIVTSCTLCCFYLFLWRFKLKKLLTVVSCPESRSVFTDLFKCKRMPFYHFTLLPTQSSFVSYYTFFQTFWCFIYMQQINFQLEANNWKNTISDIFNEECIIPQCLFLFSVVKIFLWTYLNRSTSMTLPWCLAKLKKHGMDNSKTFHEPWVNHEWRSMRG